MNAFLISIGNELLIGDTINTNVAWLGNFLARYDIETVKSITIGDSADEIIEGLTEGASKSELVIITGGLGPTHDDITKKTMADFFGVGMIEHAETASFVRAVFEKRGIPLSKSNLEQAMVPENCDVLFNKKGTAPGMWFDVDGVVYISLPGVPAEMKYLMESEALPKLKNRFGLSGSIYRHYIHTSGIGESTLSDLVIGDISEYLNNGTEVAYLPHSHGVTLRITKKAETREMARQLMEPLLDIIREKAAAYVFSEEYRDTIEVALARILTDKKLTIATAESCTGGLIGDKLTNIPGSSSYYQGGIVAYSNDIKQKFLDVPSETLESYGAVSAQTAMVMAKSVAQKFGTNIGLATTGIAGPGGGTPDKPVGTVWFGYWDENHHFALHVRLFKDRMMNKERTALIGMDIVRRVVQKVETMPYNIKPVYPE